MYVCNYILMHLPVIGSWRAVNVWSQGGIICISNQHPRCDSSTYNFTSRTHRTHGGWVTNKCYITQRKLPPRIAPVKKIIQRSKSVEILSNSGLRNPALVNLMRVELVYMFYPGIYIYKFIHKGCVVHVNWSAHHIHRL